MNWDEIKGNWKRLKGNAQKEWGKLTDDDMKIIEGEQTQLIGRIQERYGYTREQAEKAVADWHDRSRETSMTKNAEGAAGDLTADLAALRRDVERLAETMSELVQHQTQAAGIRVSEAVGDARDKMASIAADAQNRVRAASGEIEASIQRNPLTAVLIAFGIGMSLAMMSRSRG